MSNSRETVQSPKSHLQQSVSSDDKAHSKKNTQNSLKDVEDALSETQDTMLNYAKITNKHLT